MDQKEKHSSNPIEYLNFLQERNKLKKEMASKTKEDLINDEKERGFRTHFLGANEDHVKRTIQAQSLKESKDASSGQKKGYSGKVSRKGWLTTPPKFILGRVVENDSAGNFIENDNDDLDERNYENDFDEEDEEEKEVSNQKTEHSPKLIKEHAHNNSREKTEEINIEYGGSIEALHSHQNFLRSEFANSEIIERFSRLDKEKQLAFMTLLDKFDMRDEDRTEVLIQSDGNRIDSIKILPISNSNEGGRDRIKSSPNTNSNANLDENSSIVTNKERCSESIVLRIRIHSTWSNCKYVCLQKIRIVTKYNDLDIDLTESFSFELLYSGEIADKSSEAMLNFSKLLSNSKPIDSNLWRCNFKKNFVTEIKLIGDVETINHKHHIKLNIYDTELIVGNGCDANSSIQSHLASPVKDVDIFYNMDCLYSGQLEKALCINKLKEWCTIRLPLKPFSKKNEDLQMNEGNCINGSTNQLPSNLSKDHKDHENFVTVKEMENPLWLEGLKSVVEEPSIRSDSEKNENKSVRRHASQQDGLSDNESLRPQWLSDMSLIVKRDNQISEDALLYSDSKANDCSKHVDFVGTPTMQINVIEGASKERRRKRNKNIPEHEQSKVSKLDDASFRSSVEKIVSSDRRGRGRLSQIASLGSSSVVMEDLTNEQIYSGNTDGALSLNRNYNEIGNDCDNKSTPFQDVYEKRSSRKQILAERINKVQETVQNTVEKLAKVISEVQHEKAQLNNEWELSNEKNIGKTSCLENFGSEEKVVSIQAKALPFGNSLNMEILSTWGDQFYVGLNGFDIFDDNGKLVRSDVQSITTTPADINVLPEYENDPRIAANLIDGINFTRDDLHVWLAPILEPVVPLPQVQDRILASVDITFRRSIRISMIRIFNYNKSRTHTSRGVKRCRIRIGNIIVFEGDIKKANGSKSADSASDVLLFTDDEIVLREIAAHDINAGYFQRDQTEEIIERLRRKSERPSTASGIRESRDLETSAILNPASFSDSNLSNKEYRPLTAANYLSPEYADNLILDLTTSINLDRSSLARSLKSNHCPSTDNVTFDKRKELPIDKKSNFGRQIIPIVNASDLISCRFIKVELLSTYGSAQYGGLTGLQVLAGDSCTPLPLDSNCISAQPRGLCAIGSFDDKRVPENLLNGENNTTEDSKMWLFPYTKGSSHFLVLDLGSQFHISGIRIWNYNKVGDDSDDNIESLSRGIQLINILCDNATVGCWQLRIAPGADGVDFGQTILFRDLKLGTRCEYAGFTYRDGYQSSIPKFFNPLIKQDYENIDIPCGLMWKLVFRENWNDSYYIGLDAIELFDGRGRKIDLGEPSINSIGALPRSLQDIQTNSNTLDCRTPEKLFIGREAAVNVSWLAPLSKSMTDGERRRCALNLRNGTSVEIGANFSFPEYNTLYIMFGYPISISCIRFYNYAKTPSRGVREYSIFVDNKIVYMGSLVAADMECMRSREGNMISISTLDNDVKLQDRIGQSVIFGREPSIVKNELNRVTYCGCFEQDVLCINERQVLVRSKAMFIQPNANANATDADISKRPATSFISDL